MFADRYPRAIARLAREDGSLVIALIAVIVTSGLMLSITASAVAGHRGVRFDRDHIRVVHGADAGVEDVIYRLNHPDPLQRLVPPVAMTNWQNTGDAANAGGSQFRYEVVAWPAEVGAWQIRSQARLNGVIRRVSAVIARPRRFQLAAFTDASLVLHGRVTADSYNATTWNTGNGDFGSNGTITLSGNVGADDAELHNWTAAPDPTRCRSNGNTICGGYDPIGPKTDVSSTEALGFIDEAVAAHCPATPVAFTGSSLAAGVHCFSTMTIPSDFTVTGTGAAIVYLANPTANATFSVASKVRVNCTNCSGTGGVRPEAARLQVYTKSVGAVRMGNHSHVAAAIYAPRAACGGNPSTAGAQIYGSIVCASARNQGGWSFHFDDRLRDVGSGGWRITRWAEE